MKDILRYKGYYTKVRFSADDNVLYGKIEGISSLVVFEAESASDPNKHYYYTAPVYTEATGKTYIKLEGLWTENQPFSENWKNFKVKFIQPRPGKTISTGGVKPNGDNYIEALSIDNYQYKYDGFKDETDDENHILHKEFLIKLTEMSETGALKPVNILGEDAVEFGVIADKYIQGGHTETNFAVRKFDHNANIEIFGSGEGAMPFYAGEIMNNLQIDGRTNVDCDVFYAPEDESKVHLDVTLATASGYPTSKAEINEYVGGLLTAGTTKSNALAGNVTVKPDVPTDLNNAILDFTGFPENTTIYVDASNLKGAFAQQGIKINKKEGQSIVFNFPGEGPVNLNKFTVTTYDDNFEITGTVAKTNGKTYIYISDIEYKDEEDKTIYDSIKATLYEEYKGKSTKIKECEKEEQNITLKEHLSKVTFNIDDYNSDCKDLTKSKLYLEIEVTKEGKETYFKIPLELEDICPDK